MKRRFFLFAAPAIVAAPSLMRVSTLPVLLAPSPMWVSYGSLHVSQAEMRDYAERLFREVLDEVARTTGITDLMRGEPLRA
jgi:hypothetical protein